MTGMTETNDKRIGGCEVLNAFKYTEVNELVTGDE